ncbi:MAG: ABC transporter permease [Gemmatimonadales bacterium]
MPRPDGFEGLRARIQSLIRGLRRRDDVESEIREEFEHHIAMRAEHLQRQGLGAGEATRQARIEFGHQDSHREDARQSRGLRLFDQARFSWLDVKLGLRMLVRHPLLSLAAIFALAIGIPVGIAPAHVAAALEAPLPGDPQHRIRAIRNWDPLAANVHATRYEEFEFYARELKSFSALAAFRTSSYSVASDDGRAAPVAGTEISADGFSILRTPPLLGRTLAPSDGDYGAPEVAVLGYDFWRSRFGADPDIVGRAIRVGRTVRTVVGVMPDGFRFPSNEQLWLPLTSEATGSVGSQTSVRIVGRLADEVSAEQAQAELTAIGLPPLAVPTEGRLRLRPEVVSFGLLYMGLPRGGLDTMVEYRLVQMMMLAILLVACGNVAMLVFARTVTRFREMVIRTALGASRSRIVTQVFVETLVLAVVAAGAGVLAIDWLIRHVNIAAFVSEAALPYWLSLGVTGTAMVQAVLLAAVCATMAGVVPAIRITGRAARASVRSEPMARFGGLTSALVVGDIAVAVAAVGLSVAMVGQATHFRENDEAAGIAAAEFLAAEFRLPDDGLMTAAGPDQARFAERLATTQRELVAALSAEPGVTGVAIADALPRMDQRARPFEVEGAERTANGHTRWVSTIRIDVGFLAGLGRSVVSGRDLTAADVEGNRPVVMVNTPFAEREFPGENPLGRRIAFPTPDDGDAPVWHEIVGVVPHLGISMINPQRGAAVYLPAQQGAINPMQVAIHAGTAPDRLVARLPALVRSVDPSLVMGAPVLLSELRQGDWYQVMGIAGGLAVLVGVLVTLAASGLYAMLSLAVSERTREIGIRSALGAPARSLVMIILRRALIQISLGALLGLPFAARFVFELGEGPDGGASPALSVVWAAGLAGLVVLAVSLISFLVPTRQVLAIGASEAMRAEG